MTYIERIFDATTGEFTEREYTKKEIDAAIAVQIQLEAEAAAAATRASEKAALLAKLGISDDEAKLLLS